MAKRIKYLELTPKQKQEIIDYYKEHTSLSTNTRFRLSEGVLDKILLEYAESLPGFSGKDSSVVVSADNGYSLRKYPAYLLL